MLVGIINFGDEGNCVVKYPTINNDHDLQYIISKETQIYNHLKGSGVRTLTLSEKSCDKYLIFKEVAPYNLRSWCFITLYVNSVFNIDTKFQKIVSCFIKVFDEIKAFHNSGYCHRDIKPANIVILDEEGTPCLIDFVTAKQHSEKVVWRQGTMFYMAQDLLCGKSAFYKRKYDVESLIYSFLDCVDLHYCNSFLKPNAEDDLQDFDKNSTEGSYSFIREKHLSNLRSTMKSDHFSDSRFIELFFKFFDKLAEIPDDLEEENYTELREILISAKSN